MSYETNVTRQVKTLDVDDEYSGGLEEISAFIFPDMVGCIALLQIYEKQQGGDRSCYAYMMGCIGYDKLQGGDRSCYAYHIPGDLVQEWRANGSSTFNMGGESTKESLQAVIAENEEGAYKSQVYLVGTFATDQRIREIFRMATSLESVMSDKGTTLYFNVDNSTWSSLQRLSPTQPPQTLRLHNSHPFKIH